MRLPYRVKALFLSEGRKMVGFATMTFRNGASVTFRVSTDTGEITRRLQRRCEPLIDRVLTRIGDDPAVEIGFFKAFGKWIKGAVRAIARSKLIRGVMKGIKKVLRSPVIAKMVGLASFIPIVGPVLQSGYNAARGVDRQVSALVKRAGSGNFAAKRLVSAVAASAKRGNPAAVNLAAKMASAASAAASL